MQNYKKKLYTPSIPLTKIKFSDQYQLITEIQLYQPLPNNLIAENYDVNARSKTFSSDSDARYIEDSYALRSDDVIAMNDYVAVKFNISNACDVATCNNVAYQIVDLMLKRGRALTSTKILPMYSPTIPIAISIKLPKNHTLSMIDGQPAMAVSPK